MESLFIILKIRIVCSKRWNRKGKPCRWTGWLRNSTSFSRSDRQYWLDSNWRLVESGDGYVHRCRGMTPSELIDRYKMTGDGFHSEDKKSTADSDDDSIPELTKIGSSKLPEFSKIFENRGRWVFANVISNEYHYATAKNPNHIFPEKRNVLELKCNGNPHDSQTEKLCNWSGV